MTSKKHRFQGNHATSAVSFRIRHSFPTSECGYSRIMYRSFLYVYMNMQRYSFLNWRFLLNRAHFRGSILRFRRGGSRSFGRFLGLRTRLFLWLLDSVRDPSVYFLSASLDHLHNLKSFAEVVKSNETTQKRLKLNKRPNTIVLFL